MRKVVAASMPPGCCCSHMILILNIQWHLQAFNSLLPTPPSSSHLPTCWEGTCETFLADATCFPDPCRSFCASYEPSLICSLPWTFLDLCILCDPYSTSYTLHDSTHPWLALHPYLPNLDSTSCRPPCPLSDLTCIASPVHICAPFLIRTAHLFGHPFIPFSTHTPGHPLALSHLAAATYLPAGLGHATYC